VLKICN